MIAKLPFEQGAEFHGDIPNDGFPFCNEKYKNNNLASQQQ